MLAVSHSGGGRERAEQLLVGHPDASVIGPAAGLRETLAAARGMCRSGVAVVYLVDIGSSTTLLAPLARLRGKRVVLDTGDAVYALARSLGDRGFPSMLLVGLGERIALRCANEIVVRGSAHVGLVPGRATQIADLAPSGAEPIEDGRLRRDLGLEDKFVVGLVGSLVLSRRHGTSYGWDLVEALPRLDPSVAALIVGDGTGLQSLQARATSLGVADRCRFVGAVATAEIGAYVGAMDAAISTQTNDVVGQVRTTGKLPMYLANGCPVIATDVGEAAILLGPHGWTLPYTGVVDPEYPERLAGRIESWRRDSAGQAARRRTARDIFAAEFDVAEMRQRLREVLVRARR